MLQVFVVSVRFTYWAIPLWVQARQRSQRVGPGVSAQDMTAHHGLLWLQEVQHSLWSSFCWSLRARQLRGRTGWLWYCHGSRPDCGACGRLASAPPHLPTMAPHSWSLPSLASSPSHKLSFTLLSRISSAQLPDPPCHPCASLLSWKPQEPWARRARELLPHMHSLEAVWVPAFYTTTVWNSLVKHNN